ncbi:olfactomedin-4-like isoform X2 [Antennarius striatus]|uniref:olfactomedin-4-like isoform X2 n=1 Tax=Antennarius striatus TaxID=241820 RepID=UPI0035B2F227
MMLRGITLLWALVSLTQQAPSQDKCVCEFENSQNIFPREKLSTVEEGASKCNSDITPQQTLDLEILLLGLKRRLPQLEGDVSILEKEDDGDLYGVVSLQVVENELLEIRQLLDRLNSTSRRYQRLTVDATKQLEDLKEEMEEMEMFDTLQVVKGQQDNQRLKRDLDQCRHDLQPSIHPTRRPERDCPHGDFKNISGPRVYTAGEYPGSYIYGAWGQDPKPEVGKEDWYWVVMLTSGNKFSNYVRRYSSLSSLVIGKSVPGNTLIHTANPTTNTIQGPNAVLYGEALYYNCYNQDAVCRFNLTAKTVINLKLPPGTRYNSKSNFCHLDECYHFTDMDLMTDESGVWVVYTTTQDHGNIVLSKMTDGEELRLTQTWHTSVYKQGVTNTFMICGVLYATRYVDKTIEEIFYSFDTMTGVERFDIGVFITKMTPNIYSLNYSPVDQMLHVYSNAKILSYKVIFS